MFNKNFVTESCNKPIWENTKILPLINHNMKSFN